MNRVVVYNPKNTPFAIAVAADHGVLPLMPCENVPTVDDDNGEEVVYIVDLEKHAPPPFMPITPVEW